MARHRWLIPRDSPGRTERGRASASRDRSFTRCISARSRPRARGRPPPPNFPSWPDWASPCSRSCPSQTFPGRFGWGYDGVCFFAPTRLYGEPDDFRRFVDRAHGLGLGVILDVVYNHVGPDGNYLERFSRDYFTDRYATDWGTALNFDGPHCGPVREFYASNAGYWIDEFHLDGLRLDATQSIFDRSPEHILAAVTRRVREAARGRATIVVAENEPQDARLAALPIRGRLRDRRRVERRLSPFGHGRADRAA